MTEQLIELQQAHMTQYTKDGIKSEWFVRENITDRDLYQFPSTISDQNMFIIMKMAREAELKAFNAGIEFQKNNANKLLATQNKHLISEVEDLRKRNEALNNILTQKLIEQEI